MAVRRLLLDEGPGERRGVVLLDGRPERLLIERDGEAEGLVAGQRAVARVRRIDKALGLAFLDLGPEEATAPAAGLVEGAPLLVEVSAPARRGKLAAVRIAGEGTGEPRLLEPAPGLTERLQAFAPDAPIERGPDAADAADEAEEAVIAAAHALAGGGSLTIERTRALTAIDIDVGSAGGGDRRRAAAKTNQAALHAAARLLRLKGLGGLVVFDLAGGGQAGEAVLAAARQAFAPDMPGVAFGPVSRLGVFHLALPWRKTPTEERLRDADGQASARTVAQRLARAIEREARGAVRVRASCAPEVAAAAKAAAPALLARLGPRFDIQADPALGREQFVTRPS